MDGFTHLLIVFTHSNYLFTHYRFLLEKDAYKFTA